MPTIAQERGEWTPSTVHERQAVLAQMERILASPPFRHSRRYPVLLRYVVEQTLSGHAEALKERSLGVEAFQRDAAYDTNLDPIVRITAGEVRKRIAQYYHEAGHDDELRIDLPAGSYVPVFSLQPGWTNTPTANTPIDEGRAGNAAEGGHLAELPGPIVILAHELTDARPAKRWPARWIIAAGFVTLAATAAWAVIAHRQSALNAAWAPMLTSENHVLISVGEPRLAPKLQAAASEGTSSLTIRDHVHQAYVVFSDVQALSRITTQLTGQHRDYRLEPASSTSFADLRQGPAILIGGFDNPWTLRALSRQRFQFVRDPDGPLRIVDRHDPGNRRWFVDFNQIYADLTQDYAIVARFTDPDTHQPVMIVAGIGEDGTKAAGELLTDPASFRALFPADSGFSSNKNFEAVIGAQVINGVSGPPRVLATEVW